MNENDLWWAKEIRVIVVKRQINGKLGTYSNFDFYLKNGMKIGKISETELKNKR